MTKLTKKPIKKKVIPEEQEAKFWDEVDELAQEKIYGLLTRNLPLANLKLITEIYAFEQKQAKLAGLFLSKDADYRTLLLDIENQYSEADLPDKEYLAAEIALSYCHLSIKAIIADLSEYSCYDPSYFENLTDYEN